MADSPPNRKPRLPEPPESSPDKLTSLPLDVLDNILSRLRIDEVVRTSALSRAWRQRWESLPSLDLANSVDLFASDIDAVLLRRSAPVRRFRLVVIDLSWLSSGLHDWLLFLSRNGVHSLTLILPPVGFQLHSCLFSCSELTCLRLNGCCIPPAPSGFAGFLNLTSLRLKSVCLPKHGGRELAALIAASPLLEEVELLGVELVEEDPEEGWVIRAPNLRNLVVVSDFAYHGGRAEDLPRLEEVSLFGPNYAKFLTGMARVSKLEFYSNSMLSTEVDVLERLPFLFENLRSLVLAVNFCEISHILSIFCLIRSAPNLEELDVWGCSSGSEEIEANEDFLNAQWTNDMFAKLLVVRMRKTVCLCNEMHFAEFVLSKARVLRILSVTLASDCLCSNGEVVIELTEYPRASPEAQVFFMGRESASSCSINTPTVLSGAQTQTTGSRLIDDTRSRRRQRELREAQQEHVEAQREREEAQRYHEQAHQHCIEAQREREEAQRYHEEAHQHCSEAQRYMEVTRQHREYMMSTI